ncbi:pili assembly chaperone [Pantoea agglomerans]|uniref:pili assembly chaperone n=1 Tax=Enterobacter agglomerans TaxID=549 RepID=UPI001782F417|nr:pili assembly chaperone [Pantoea agglomerans]MBD8197354.1 pili assembly chaperone [Pantoea agglomerans]
MQQRLVILTLILWLTLTLAFSLLTPAGPGGVLTLWMLTAASPFLLRPFDWLTRQLLRKPCMLSRRKRITVHLSPCQPTVGLTRERVSWFWSGVNEAAESALQEGKTVVIASHLLTPVRTARLRAYLTARGCSYCSRLTSVPFSDSARALMQLEILFRQWRWRCPSRSEWPVMLLWKSSEPEK